METHRLARELRKVVKKTGKVVDTVEAQEKGAESEDRVRSRLCRTVGVELWRGKGWILGGGVFRGDRGEHAGSLLKCQECLQRGSGERRVNAVAMVSSAVVKWI